MTSFEKQKELKDKICLTKKLFAAYPELKTQLEFQKIGLKYAQNINKDAEIEGMTFTHQNETDEKGKSNVIPVSKKTETIALTLDEKIQREIEEYKKRILLLENVIEQIDLFVSILDKKSQDFFNAHYIKKKSRNEMAISADVFKRRINKLALTFIKFSTLKEIEIKMALLGI